MIFTNSYRTTWPTDHFA